MKLAGTLIGHRWGRIVLHGRCCLRNGQVVWVLAILVSLRCAANSPAAYLASVGPAPLRFQAPLDAKPKPVSSPLPQDKPILDLSGPEPAAATNVIIVATSPATLPVTEPVSSPTQPYTPAVLSTNEVAITPQMVVEFFRSHGGANGNRENAVMVPFNFTPPTPISKTPSTATYETP